MKMMKNKKQRFAIIHHSEMTDILLYFISERKESLVENESLLDDFVNYETFENYERLKKELEENKILFLNSETIENNAEIEDLIVVKYYSYRF